jgi:hypothetical protein
VTFWLLPLILALPGCADHPSGSTQTVAANTGDPAPRGAKQSGGSREEAASTTQTDAEPEHGAAGDDRNVHGLLVGCTAYDHLAPARHLKGPMNDVRLIRRLLIEKFNFAAGQIVSLVEDSGDDARPTRKNIEREFKRLAEKARANDRVVILLSGHGSRQPSDPGDREDIEPDGLDEVFCPADVARLSAADGGKIENAIIDDELKQWLEAISNTGASVWFIADSCHSGTVSRSDDVRRGFDARELLSVAERGKAKYTGATRGTGDEPLAMEVPASAKGAFVALYASQPNQETYEATFDGTRYGLLTYSLCHVLLQCETPLTYRELQRRIHARYQERDGYPPTPLLEGKLIGGKSDSRDMEILGTTTLPGRSRLSLRAAGGGRFTVNGGSLHDLTVGSVLAIYPAAGKTADDELLGHVRVTEVSPLEAKAEPCQFAAKGLRGDFPEENRCEVAFFDYRLRQLKLAVDPLGETSSKSGDKKPETAPVAAARLESLRQRAALLDKGKGAAVKVVDDLREADWLVRLRDGRPYLVHRSLEAGQPTGELPAFGPIPDDADDKFRDWLDVRLTRIARATTLTRLAGSSLESNRSNRKVDVEVEMLRFADRSAKDGKPILWQRDGVRLKVGEIIGFRVTNRGKTAVDVCLMFVDSGFGILQFFPEPGTAGNRLEPGNQLHTNAGEVQGSTLGTEHLVLVAVAARPLQEPLELAFLQQPPCSDNERAPVEKGEAVPRTDSPLERFLIESKKDVATMRGFGRTSLDAHALRLFTWQTVRQ